MTDLFFYGTLCDADLLACVLGHAPQPSPEPAKLPGYRVAAVEGHGFPMLVKAPDGRAEGVLLRGLSPGDVARLEFYEGVFAYGLRPVRVIAGNGPADARVFIADDAGLVPAGDWRLADWQARDKALAVEAAAEEMGFFGEKSLEEMRALRPGIRMRAWSRLLARKGGPRDLARPFSREGDVEAVSRRHAHAGFFLLEEHRLRHRRFDGRMSPELWREVFLTADAVTVLPYDPGRDLVLLIEQFRAGPFGRGDPAPWCLEPIAGRVDAGEAPEATARREAEEEAGIVLSALERIGGYYSSPGAFGEYLHSYLGLCALSPGMAGVHGLDAEDEDIRTLVIPFARLMEMVETGEAENGPLLVSALWLARNRERLREQAG